MLRSLGSPENVYRAVATGAAEFSTVTKLEVTEARPGFAEVAAVAVDGYPRSPEHCDWTSGLMSCTSTLFGLEPAHVLREPRPWSRSRVRRGRRLSAGGPARAAVDGPAG